MLKNKFRIVHAADLHLGAPFKGLATRGYGGGGSLPAGLRETLVGATYAALESLVKFCLEVKPHALLLAGDLYNPEGGGLKSLNALKSACQKLEAANVMVLMIHGNHDAANLQPSWSWPENVHVFRADRVESIPIFLENERLFLGAPFAADFPQEAWDNADCLAIIHGISHIKGKVTDNLAIRLAEHSQKIIPAQPPEPRLEDAWKIGLLHCAVGEKASDGEKAYAPCSIDDLRRADVDYWALGHIHKQGMVTHSPLAWYPGNSQGMHINETGPKGCLIVDFNEGTEPGVKFQNLAGIEWHQLEFEANPEMTLSHLQEASFAQVKKIHSERSPAGLKGIIVRLRIYGRTQLDGWLRGRKHEFETQIQSSINELVPFVWLKDIIIETRPALDLDRAIADPGLLGETLTRIMDARDRVENSLHLPPDQQADLRDELFAGSASPLGDLFNSPALRQAGIVAPGNAELASLLEEAAWLCADLLANEFPGASE